MSKKIRKRTPDQPKNPDAVDLVALRRSMDSQPRSTSTETKSFAHEKWVRIMCDYAADPIWSRSGGNVDLEDLPVSADLLKRLLAWQGWYQHFGWKDFSDAPSGLDIYSFSPKGWLSPKP